MTDRAGSTTADDLLELLTKVPDVSTLEIFLEPQHLLKLLRAQGWSDADIRRDLTNGGSTPGKLLLGVLAKEPDCSVLLGLLGNPARHNRTSKHTPSSDPSRSRCKDSLRNELVSCCPITELAIAFVTPTF